MKALPLRTLLVVFVTAEAAYLAASRLWLPTLRLEPVQHEVGWTILRLIESGVLLWLVSVRPLPAVVSPSKPNPQIGYIIGCCILIVPLGAAELNLPPTLRWVSAASSFVVGLREELGYRGILQFALRMRLGLWPALMVSNGLFLAAHIGAFPLTAVAVAEILVAGLALGLCYELAGSLFAVVLVHGLYNAIECLSPVFPASLPKGPILGAIGCGAVALAYVANGRARSPTQLIPPQ